MYIVLSMLLDMAKEVFVHMPRAIFFRYLYLEYFWVYCILLAVLLIAIKVLRKKDSL
jgi:hypothetical protein